MKKLFGITLLFLQTILSDAKNITFDFGWQFSQDSTNWVSVDLPHDWDASATPSKGALSGNDGGYYPGGIGYYRKQFVQSLPAPGTTLKLHFEGVYQNAQIKVNGALAGRHFYGYTPFKIDITPYVREGNNLIEVRVDNSTQPNCRWYSGSGIYRHVWLETHKQGEIDEAEKLKITTTSIKGISSDATSATSATVRIEYDGRLVREQEFTNVNLWSPDHPNLYDIKAGELTVKYGIRQIEYDSQHGFLLNGQKILINGACIHHDDGVLGAAAFDAAEIRKVRLMKQAGFNLIRTSHNPSTRAFLDACDSLGMMVIDEAFDGWRSSKTNFDYHLVIDSCYSQDITAMVCRDRNHPSVISWSIGNEVIERKDIRVVTTARQMKKAILAVDTTRPVTEALCTWDRDWEIYDPHAEVLDIVGYNYMIHKHATDHQRSPERIIWQTESYPRDAFSNWNIVEQYPYVIGDIVWTGLDYFGESGIGRFYYEGETAGEHYQAKQFPYHGAYCGDVDITGWRKPISHYRSMLWTSTPSLYMAVREPDGYKGKIHLTAWSVWPAWESWNWKGWEGKDIQVEVYTKHPTVTLYLNGNAIATQNVSRATQYKATFTIPYQPGTLTAKAGGQETSLVTTDQAISARLTPDHTIARADGQDLIYVTLEAIDRQGRWVPDAVLPLDIKVSGEGTLLAAATADFHDLEPMSSSHLTTWQGRAIVVIRTTQKPGTITITPSKGKPVKIKTKK